MRTYEQGKWKNGGKIIIQRHLKQDCLISKKGHNTSKMPQTLPIICRAYIEDKNKENAAMLVGIATNWDKKEVMAKL